MKKLAFALILIAAPAFAQAPPSPEIALYRQLLDNANAQMVQSVAALQAQNQQLQTQITDLQKQLTAAKSTTTEAPANGK